MNLLPGFISRLVASDPYQTYRWRFQLAASFFRAWLHRRRLVHTTFVGVTGSVGKTTTKDLAALILAEAGSTGASRLSLNTPLAIAEALLGIGKQDRFAVIEFGAFKPGAFDLPVRLVKPTIGVITVIGRDHYSAFRSLEAIAAEKGKLILALPPAGTAVLNVDDPHIRRIGERCRSRVLWIGRSAEASLRLLDASSRWPETLRLTVEYQDRVHTVDTGLHGTHLALSVLAALGVALAAGMELERAIAALAKATPSEGRMQVVSVGGGVTFLRDDFKAPHWALNSVFEFMRQAQAQRKIVVIGTVSDSPLGPSKRYSTIAREVREFADLVVFVGQDAHKALKARSSDADLSILAYPTLRQVADFFDGRLQNGDLVLLKGTNPQDHLERLVWSRSRPVTCWASDCGLTLFCGECPRLYQPPSE